MPITEPEVAARKGTSPEDAEWKSPFRHLASIISEENWRLKKSVLSVLSLKILGKGVLNYSEEKYLAEVEARIQALELIEERFPELKAYKK